MKKIKKIMATVLLGSVMACSLAGCGDKDKTNTEQGGTENITSNDITEDNLPEITSNTPAYVLLADFREKMADYKSTEDMANALIANKIIPFMGATMPVSEGYLNGFTEEIKGFKAGTMFGPAIGSIPFVGYVFEVDGDVDSFVKNLQDKSDLRWNVCTSADEMVCEANGNVVFFVMAPAEFEE